MIKILRAENKGQETHEVLLMQQRLKETGSPLYSEAHRQMYDFPVTHWCAGKTVLEIGIGYGIERIAPLAEKVVAIDVDRRCVNHARQAYAFPNVTCREADICTWDAPAESFDVAVMIDVIEHIRDDVGALKNTRRLLLPGGVLFVSTPWPNLEPEGNPRNVCHVREYYPREFHARIAAVFEHCILFERRDKNLICMAQKAWN